MIQVRRWLMLLIALALVVCLAVPALAEDKRNDKITEGTIKSVAADQNQFMLTDKDGRDVTFQVSANSKILIPKDMNAKLSQLKAGEQVAILAGKKGGQNTARAVLVKDGDFRDAGLASGTVKRVASDTNDIMVQGGDGKEWTYHMADQAKIRLSDKDAKLTDLKNNDHVFIVWDKQGATYRVLALCDHGRKIE